MSIKDHDSDYRPSAYLEYTVEELQWWVKLLTKRAGMRTDPEKQRKDLYDASNYQKMLDDQV